MEKRELLQEIIRGVQEGVITESEVVGAIRAGSVTVVTHKEPAHVVNMANILSYIGAGIVFLGIAILVGQNWNEMTALVRILVTLGVGLVAYISGVLLGGYPHLERPSQALYLISALLIPGGLAVVFEEFTTFEPLQWNFSIAFLSLVLFAVSFLLVKRNHVFLMFSIAFATWLVYSSVLLLLDTSGIFLLLEGDIMAYVTLIMGVSYLLIGYGLSKIRWYKLTPVLYFFGSLGVMVPTITLGGVWDALFAGVVAGVLFLSVYLKSRVFLLLGTLFLIGYIIKLTSEYFADTVGWPLALVVLGLVLIGVGYGAFRINTRITEEKEYTLN